MYAKIPRSLQCSQAHASIGTNAAGNDHASTVEGGSHTSVKEKEDLEFDLNTGESEEISGSDLNTGESEERSGSDDEQDDNLSYRLSEVSKAPSSHESPSLIYDPLAK